MSKDIISISMKTFTDFYKDILTTATTTRPWFFREEAKKFTLVIPESPLIIMVVIKKDKIVTESPDKEKLEYDEIINKWRVDNLNNAIPFEKFILDEISI